ncbi:MAG: DUF1269 domain-containing protein [Gammaproteobacteria bacterium]|nr:DUF1269 domain-containing protein [Gammaproteobacteria bacterium]
MRRRMYFLLPDVRSAKVVHNELLLAKIEERYMHVIAKEGTTLDDLPEAGIRQKTDLVHGLQIGLVLGGFTGMFLSTLALMMNFIVHGLEVWSVGSLVFGGALFGAFASSMIAVNVSNTRLKSFLPDVEQGRILFMVDVPIHRLKEITLLIEGHHPEADMRGIDPQIPAFP